MSVLKYLYVEYVYSVVYLFIIYTVYMYLQYDAVFIISIMCMSI